MKLTVGRTSHVPNVTIVDTLTTDVESFPLRDRNVKLVPMGGPVLSASKKVTFAQTVQIEKPRIIPNGPKISEVIQGYASSNRRPDAHVHAEIGISSSFIPVKILMDTGASFSCLSFQCFQKMQDHGVPVRILPTQYNNPVAADGSPMPICGDVLLEVRFKGSLNGKEELVHVQDCRFAIFKALSSNVIMGIDNLGLLQFEISPSNEIKIGAARMSILSVKPEFDGRSRFSLISSVLVNQVRWCLYEPDPERDVAIEAISSRSSIKEVEMQDYLLVPLSMDTTVSQTILAGNESAVSPDNLNSVCDSTKTDSAVNNGVESDAKISLDKQDDPSQILKDFITQLVSLSEFTTKGKHRLKAILTDNIAVFSTEDTDVGEYKLEKVKLELKPGQTEAAYVPSRRIPFALRDWLEKHLMKSLRAGIIE